MINLAKDMKSYCIYSKHYFDVRDNGSTEALPVVDDFDTVSADELSGFNYTLPDNIEHFTYKGTTLLLKDQTSFRLYFESDDVRSLTIKEGENSLKIRKGQGSYTGMYYVEMSNISAKNLDTSFLLSGDIIGSAG